MNPIVTLMGSEMMVNARFWLEVGTYRYALFQECSGLSLQTDSFEYNEGGLNSYTHKLPVRTKVGNVTVKRALVVHDGLWKWYEDVVSGNINRRSIIISATDNKVDSLGRPKVIFVLDDALPIKWTGPAFKASESAIAVESIEFVTRGFKRIDLG